MPLLYTNATMKAFERVEHQQVKGEREALFSHECHSLAESKRRVRVRTRPLGSPVMEAVHYADLFDYYCGPGLPVFSSRSRMFSNVAASISPRA
jgi:hypothetical protein